jgi:threonyl-tRNA synthetase
MERLFPHLIEVHAGALPVLARCRSPPCRSPPSSSRQRTPSPREAIAAGLRVEVDHDGSVGARIRSAAQRRIPYVAAIGANEAPHGLVALRLRDGRQPPAIPGSDAVSLVAAVAAARSHDLLPTATVAV